jgi:hypothetical protein
MRLKDFVFTHSSATKNKVAAPVVSETSQTMPPSQADSGRGEGVIFHDRRGRPICIDLFINPFSYYMHESEQ